MSVNRRTRHGSRSRSGSSRRSQQERRSHTRQALLDAALLQIEAGESFESLSLRSVARAAGVVPTAFYRHFESMDELGLTLVEESFRTLRAMLREARDGLPPRHVIRRSVEILVEQVREHRPHFVFIVRVGYTGNTVLRHAVRSEIRLITSELATDLTRFPVLRDWTTDDLQMLAGLLVNTMISTVAAMLDAPVAAPEAEAEIAGNAERQLRLIVLGAPSWRSGPRADR
ncbi:MAG TPA: TetR family transcriptional regulator [Solirubrobacteraceae bacterium]